MPYKAISDDELVDFYLAKETCKWKNPQGWELVTSCGNSLLAVEEGFGWKFCPFCGKEIKKNES